MDKHNSVKDSDGNTNLNWQDEFQAPNSYVAYYHKLVNMLTQFENMRNAHFGSIG